ncbi:2667_t:CDS:1, partial [Cetraspora pellucida]
KIKLCEGNQFQRLRENESVKNLKFMIDIKGNPDKELWTKLTTRIRKLTEKFANRKNSSG